MNYTLSIVSNRTTITASFFAEDVFDALRIWRETANIDSRWGRPTDGAYVAAVAITPRFLQ